MDSHYDEDLTRQKTERLAGFWMRFWAYMVDVFVLFSINGFLLSPFKFINDGQVSQLGYWTVTGILASLIFYSYFLLMTKFFGQTLGKMVFGLKVINEHDKALTWTDLFFREVIGRLIYNIIWMMKVFYLVVAFTPDKQGFHDMIGKTRVIHLN